MNIAQKFLTGVSLGAALLVALAQGARAVTVFTDPAAFEAAVPPGPIQTFAFDGDEAEFEADSIGNIIGPSLTLDLIGGGFDPGPTGLTGTGFLQGEVDATAPDALQLEFNIPTAFGFGILGLQNDSATDPAGLSLEEIGVVVAGESFLVSDILGLTDSSDGAFVSTVDSDGPIPFLGFVTDTPIDSFFLVQGDLVAPGGVAGSFEEFFVDGLVVAEVPFETNVLPGLVVAGLAAAGLKLKGARTKAANRLDA